MKALCHLTTAVDYQDISMRHALQLSPHESLADFAHRFALHITPNLEGSPLLSDICLWRGVECEGPHITAILWPRQNTREHAEFSGKSLDIHWLPPRLREIRMRGRWTAHGLSMRKLPRSLIAVDMETCSLAGSLETQHFPKDIHGVNMRDNELMGILSLLDLPPNLKILDLCENRFAKVYVCNAALPGNLEFIQVAHNKRKCKVSEINGKRCDSRVVVSEH